MLPRLLSKVHDCGALKIAAKMAKFQIVAGHSQHCLRPLLKLQVRMLVGFSSFKYRFHCGHHLLPMRRALYYVTHGPVHFAGQDSTIIQDAHRTKIIVTEIVYVYIQHSTLR